VRYCFLSLDFPMKTVFSPRHLGHANQLELVAGAIVPGFELTSRAEYVSGRIKTVGLGPILPPQEHDLTTASRIHRKDYLDFLPTIWDRWMAEGRTGTALALHLADPRPARRCAAGIHRWPARLLLLRRRLRHRRRLVGRDQILA
jgi:acetoin utilization deacetylase AcuC-like enzyme